MPTSHTPRDGAPPIEHVVVLMLENRSFDHMLGFLDHSGLEPVTEDPPGNPEDPDDPSAPVHFPFELRDHQSLSHDPKHGYEDVMQQLAGTRGPWQAPYALTNTGFAWNYLRRRGGPADEVLGCYPPARLPILSTLAREFAVCSRWFCSLPSETWPNRLFAHGGTSDNLVRNEVRFYTNRTIFEALSTADYTWQIYAGDIPQVAAYRRLWWHDDGPRFSRLNEFFEHARSGRLRNYSFIEPRHFGSAVSSQHPLASVLLGEQLLRDVYLALASNAKTWRSSLLIVTYDEHGGFFDREPPPEAIPPEPDAEDPEYGFRFDLLGPRVPAVVISPYIRARTVFDQTLDHTSIAATLREIFHFDETLTERDASATGIAAVLVGDDAREPVGLPELPRVGAAELGPEAWADGVAPEGTIQLNDLQQQLVELALLVESEQVAVATPTGIESAPLDEPVFRSEAELGEFIEAFRRRQMDQM